MIVIKSVLKDYSTPPIQLINSSAIIEVAFKLLI